MSKAARQSIFILIILLLGAFGFASFTYLQKQQLQQAKISLEGQLEDYQAREKQQLVEMQKLQEKLKGAEQAKADLEKRLSSVDVDIDDIDAKMKKLTEERDEWKRRVDEIKLERDKVVAKLDEKEKEGPKVVYKYVEQKGEGEALAQGAATQGAEATSSPGSMTEDKPQEKAATTLAVQDDSYWAQVLKEKAALELELDKLKGNLTNNSVEVVELKKKNTDLQLELSQLANDKETIQREIKYANDLADNLALELARAKNDKKFLNDRLTKINDENTNLREQIKRLTSTKIALEKTIIRIQDEKKDVEKKLSETENVIQSRIDEIWQIKESLTKSTEQMKPVASQEIELPPIVVSSAQTKEEQPKKSAKPAGYNGNIVSVNEENNFVIVDLGEDSGVKLGETLNVYRGSEYIAGLEVIQTRKDISAADIKDQVAKIKVGDIVR
jgi:chromosome segregation ATPase